MFICLMMATTPPSLSYILAIWTVTSLTNPLACPSSPAAITSFCSYVVILSIISFSLDTLELLLRHQKTQKGTSKHHISCRRPQKTPLMARFRRKFTGDNQTWLQTI
jgi:uncharacterized membrane protein (UPF0182 family)